MHLIIKYLINAVSHVEVKEEGSGWYSGKLGGSSAFVLTW